MNESGKKLGSGKLSRRSFVTSTMTAAAGLTILPSGIISAKGRVAPSDKLNIAGIGTGGMGNRNLLNLKEHNIVAMCDVDWSYAAKSFTDFPNEKKTGHPNISPHTTP